MRYLLGPLVLSALSFSCGSSKDDDENVTPLVTLGIDLRPQFEDFGPSASSDGTKAVFISQRAATSAEALAKAYLFDASLDVKQVLLSDKITGLSSETEKNVAISPNGAFVAILGQTAAAQQILVGQLGGAIIHTVDLPTGSTVRRLQFDPGSKILAVDLLNGRTPSVELYIFSGDATALTFVSASSLTGEEKPQFVNAGASLQLTTLLPAGSTNTVNSRIFDTVGQTFSAATAGPSLTNVEAESAYFTNAAGLFSVEKLTSPRLKLKLGSTPGDAPNVVVAEALKQTDVFATALTYDFTSANYLKAEPVAISGIHGSSDGEYLLVAGLDSYYCARNSTKVQLLNLVRRADMKTIGLSLGRPAGEKVWTEIATDPCSLLDPDTTKVAYEFDGALQNAQLVSVVADVVQILVESTVTVDREIKLLRFTADWAAGTISTAEIVEISANPRP